MATPPRAGQLDQISEAIGGLNAHVDGIKDTLKQIARERESANTEIFRRLNEISSSIAEMKEIKPTVQVLAGKVEVLEKTKNRVIGILTVVSALITLTGIAAGEYVKWYLLGK